MNLAEATEAYQAQRELERANPDEEELEELTEIAKRDLEIAWLESRVQGT